MAEKTKYSKDELEGFRAIINDKLKSAKEDLQLLVDQLSHKDDHGTDDTSPTFKLMDEGSEVLSREEINQLAARQQKFTQSLESALIRIENGTYGVCRVTGKLIAKERLKIVPHATLSIEAKNAQG
jgi:RNA polymerase-binding transcription factor DksA